MERGGCSAAGPDIRLELDSDIRLDSGLTIPCTCVLVSGSSRGSIMPSGQGLGPALGPAVELALELALAVALAELSWVVRLLCSPADDDAVVAITLSLSLSVPLSLFSTL